MSFTTVSNTSTSNTATDRVARTDFQAAFDSTAAARAALQPADLLPINLEVPMMVATVIGSLPRARKLRDAVVAMLPQQDVTQMDALEAYADALSHAHAAFLATSYPTPNLPALLDRATALRDQLVTDAAALARRGFVDSKRLADIKGGTGYLAVAYDVGALVHMLRERWTEISTKSAIQPSELDEAEKLYEQISRAFAERSRQSSAAASASDDRTRAYTLLHKAYDQLRRAAIYIRWEEGDADKFVPSLYAGRGGRGSSESKPAPSETTPPDGGSGTPVAPRPPVGDEVTVTAPGLPGGSPFANV